MESNITYLFSGPDSEPCFHPQSWNSANLLALQGKDGEGFREKSQDAN